MARTIRLSRLGLVIWLLAPVVFVAILWTQMDRSRGKPDPKLLRTHVPAETSIPVQEGEAVAPEATPSPPPAARPGVEPETLPQGYIIVVDDKAHVASPSSPIYLASSHNGWRAGDPARVLSQRSDGKWQIAMSRAVIDSRMEFKFTRGNWDTVEVADDLSDIKNRMLPLLDPATLAPSEPPTIELSVARWKDQSPRSDAASPYRVIKVAGGRIQRVQVVGGATPIARDLLVWLPPGYDDPANASRTYPVLYMQDGQNIFDRFPGVPGEWKADEAAVDLISTGRIDPVIIVGIPNSADRIAEYSPAPTAPGVDPRGDAYVDFLIHGVLPRVERTFRVRTGPENTAIGGSSLGALISLYAAIKHPDIFGKVLAESPTLHVGGKDVWRTAFDGFTHGPGLIVMGMGGKELGDDSRSADENNRLLEAYRSFLGWLHDRKICPAVESTIAENGQHNEAAWAERFPGDLVKLFHR